MSLLCFLRQLLCRLLGKFNIQGLSLAADMPGRSVAVSNISISVCVFTIFVVGRSLVDDMSGRPVCVYKKLETRYKKQEGEAPAAPILWPTCRWSSVSWFVVGLKPMCVYKKLETRYKKQEGEAPAAPILWPTCRWSSVSWFVVGLKPMCVIKKQG